jgi:hypothetical protein
VTGCWLEADWIGYAGNNNAIRKQKGRLTEAMRQAAKIIGRGTNKAFTKAKEELAYGQFFPQSAVACF